MYKRLASTFASGKSQTLSIFKKQARNIHGLISYKAATFCNSKVSQKKSSDNLSSLVNSAQFSTGNSWNPFSEVVTTKDRILAVEGNVSCSDCSSGDVHYVSTLNGGVYCPVCAGIHREIGIHPDFISLKGDVEVSDEDMQFYESMGNNYVNNIYEASLDVVGADKPTVASTRTEISAYIKEKYLECGYSVSRHDRPATESVLNYVSNMKARGWNVPDLRQKVIERAGATYSEIMDEAFDSPYLLRVVAE